MEDGTLELTLVSGQNIGPGRREGRVKVYAEVSLGGDPATSQKTNVDREGGTNPIWNLTFTLKIPDSSVRDLGSEVVVKLFYQRSRGDLFVGDVKIPISTLFDRGIRASSAFDVVPTGRLNISYRFGDEFLPTFPWSTWGLIRVAFYLLLPSVPWPRRWGQDNEGRRGANLQFDEEFNMEAQEKQELEEKAEAFIPKSTEQIEKMKNEAESISEAELVERVEAFIHKFGGQCEKLENEKEAGGSQAKDHQELGEKRRDEKEFQSSRGQRKQMSSKNRYLRSQDLRAKRKDEGASEFRFGKREMKDKAKSDSNKRYLGNFHLLCSIFPVDYDFTKDILFCQWIAGGLFELEEDEEMEEVFTTLMGMNYIIPSGYDYVLDQSKYKISDEMATFIANQPFEPQLGKCLDSKQSQYHDPTKVELLSLSLKEIDRAVLKQYSCLHTLVIHDCYEVDHLPSDFFSELKALKILILSRTNIVELPSSVENLKELRFLDMSNTPLVWLPETICCFTQLQTLRLDGCLQLEGLPEGTSNLINLRHLILDVVRQLESMPVGLGELTNLRTLSAFLVGEEEGCTVAELKDMNKLRGKFRLLNLENVKTKEEALEACLYKKIDLRKIEFQWSDVENEKIPHEEEILESLQPPLRIQELKIMFYSGGVLPSWICDPSFQNLVTMFLYRCRYCISLPSLGQLPSLKHLSITENNVVVEIGSSFCRKQRNQFRAAFPKLEKLTFESMSRLERWMISLHMGDFPSLRHLIIEYCPKLVELSFLWCFDSLSHLEIRYCPELSLSPYDILPSSVQSLMIKKSPRLKEWCCDKDWSKISHVPTVYFDHEKFPPEM